MSRPRTTLLPEPSAPLAEGLAHLRTSLDAAMPLRPKHRKALPGSVARLSALLTTERDHLPADYMSRPEHLAAYLHWFLPWNVLRLGRLLQGLALDLPDGARILDLGAGPCTFLLALWLARPDLRERELRCLAVDRAEPALRAGRRLFAEVAGADTPWRLETTRRPPRGGRADLLVAANVVNELDADRPGRRKGPDLEPLERLAADWERMLDPAGRLLVVEPGVRPAAARLARLRAAVLAGGWRVLAPCTHEATCPLPGRRGGAWCHFATGTEGAPRWLSALGRSAKLPKERISLSFLLTTPQGGRPAGEDVEARVVSEVFRLEGGDRGAYGCMARGLVVLVGEDGLRPGDLVRPAPTARPGRDARTGAPLLPATARGARRRRR